MGLRDYEFDVAPELLAAVARGRPGPLMDAAMSHMGNVPQAARDAAQRELNEREREMLEAIDQNVANSLRKIHIDFGSIRRRGGLDTIGVGESPSGGVERGTIRNNDVPRSRGLGTIFAGGKKIPTGSAQAFIQGLILGESSHPTQSRGSSTSSRGGSSRGSTYTPQVPVTGGSNTVGLTREEAANRIRENNRTIATERSNFNRALSLRDQALEAIAACDRGESGYTDTTRAIAQHDLAQALRDIEFALVTIKFAMIDNVALRQVRRDDPDSLNDSSSTITNAVDAHILYHKLKSLGGLGFEESSAQSSRVARVPNILRAVDPSPDEQLTSGASELADMWQFWLIDPTFPEV
ncbi:MAG: hypothetical protein JNK05_12150 [Myxococcales bacterium]|nr:hypothetical protein [Myxococcales bacterium]